MTANQIAYQSMKETMRANKAKEDELFRSNVAKETETNRSNVVKEQETERHNRFQEGLGVAQTVTSGVTGLGQIAAKLFG